MFFFFCNLIELFQSPPPYTEIKRTTAPKSKRFRPNDTVDDDAPMHLTQPVPQTVQSDDLDDEPIAQQAADRNDFCFSQPTLMDDLLLGTQLNQTQSCSENPFQRLVKRMTRFFVHTTSDETIKRITDIIAETGYTWKITDNTLITVSTVDRRKIQLVFKINLITMDDTILVDFRLSKGDGIEFKRRFVNIKRAAADIISKEQRFW